MYYYFTCIHRFGAFDKWRFFREFVNKVGAFTSGVKKE
jgi:hypothetical protein